MYGHYEKQVDRESAYEILKNRAAKTATEAPPAEEGKGFDWGGMLGGSTGPRGGHREGVFEAAAKNAARAIGSELGRQIIRGVLGSLLGGKRR